MGLMIFIIIIEFKVKVIFISNPIKHTVTSGVNKEQSKTTTEEAPEKSLFRNMQGGKL